MPHLSFTKLLNCYRVFNQNIKLLSTFTECYRILIDFPLNTLTSLFEKQNNNFHKNPFFSSTITEWNKLDVEIRKHFMLHNLVRFVQFKKRGKQPWRSVTFSKVAKSNTPPWVFFTLLNCTNNTKSRKTSHILQFSTGT